MSETSREHKRTAPKQVRFAILTVSTSRYEERESGQTYTDVSADLASRLLTAAGHFIVGKRLVSDDLPMIRASLTELVKDPQVQAILTFGGTGITPTDVTIESVKKLIEKEVTGFGEIFRNISFQRIGTAALLSRALAGIVREKPVFCLPGSPQSIELGLKELILPEIGHMLKHIRE